MQEKALYEALRQPPTHRNQQAIAVSIAAPGGMQIEVSGFPGPDSGRQVTDAQRQKQRQPAAAVAA